MNDSYMPGLKAMRTRAGLTQKQLGELIGVSAGVIGRLERGLNIIPRWHTVWQLAKALNCSTDDLCQYKEERDVNNN